MLQISHQAVDVLVCLPNLPQRRLHVVPLPCKCSKSAAGRSESHIHPASRVSEPRLRVRCQIVTRLYRLGATQTELEEKGGHISSGCDSSTMSSVKATRVV